MPSPGHHGNLSLAPEGAARDAATSHAWKDVRRDAVAVAVLFAWALVLFRPWIDAPFEFFDFGDFLPVLRAGDDFGERHRLLTDFYAHHGRYLPLTLLYTNLKWTALGWNVEAWQWLNVALMTMNTALAYHVLRRIGASRLGAFAGAGGFVVFAGATSVWQRVHTSQAQGLPFVLGAALLALGYRTSARPVLRAVAAGGMVALAILVKETFVAVAPFICLLAACQEDGTPWHAPAIDRRTVGFVVSITVACIAAMAPIVAVKLNAPPDGYAAMYDPTSIDARAIVLKARTMLFPMGDSIRRWMVDAVFVTLIVAGFALRRRQGHARGDRWLIATAISLPLAGGLLHLPWPGHGPHYASSYMLGPAMLLAIAVTGATRTGGRTRAAACAALALLALYGSLRTSEETRNFLSMRVAHAELVQRTDSLARAGSASAVLVRVREPDAYCFHCVVLTDLGRALLPAPLPPVRPVGCDVAESDAVAARAVMVDIQADCPALDAAGRHSSLQRTPGTPGVDPRHAATRARHERRAPHGARSALPTEWLRRCDLPPQHSMTNASTTTIDRQGDAIAIGGDYQHKARTEGFVVQRYWHWEKERMIRKFSAPAPGARVLDVGCGSGVIADLLASIGADTIAVDGNPDAIAYGQRTFRRPNLEFRLGLIEEIDLPDESVDHTYCFELVEHIYEHQVRRLLQTIHRLTRPGGTLTLTTPNFRGVWPVLEKTLDLLRLVPHLDGDQHVTHFHRARLREMLEQTGWRVERLSTFSTFAPFVSAASWSLAERVSALEDRLDLPFGSILFAKVTRA